MNPFSSLSFCLRNLHAAGLNAAKRDGRSATDTDPYSLLYKGLPEAEIFKNEMHIVLKNISDHAIDIPASSTIHLSWRQLLNNSSSEKAIRLSDLQATPEQQSYWSFTWINKSGPSRWWELKTTKAICLEPGSEITFLAQNISVPAVLSPTDLDSGHVTFACNQPDEKNSTSRPIYATPVSLKRLDISQDAETLPIDAAFTEPRYPEAPNKWNVSQNQSNLFHPTKKRDEVFSNTLTAVIESRLGFSIRNPGGVPLEPKSANADPRFVITMAYGENVRALSRKEDGLPLDYAVQFNGISDYIEIPSHTNPTHAITVAIWAKNAKEMWGGWGGQLICKRDAFILHGLKNSKSLAFYIFLADVGWRDVEFTPHESFSLSEWHHYALSYDGKALILYIDAQECARIPCEGSLANPTASLYFAKDPNAGEHGYLNGQLARACIFDKACSEEELQQIMDNQLDEVANALVGSYPLNLIKVDDNIPKVSDLSSKQLDGLVRGQAKVVRVSRVKSSRNSDSPQGVQLELDGMYNDDQLIQDITGIAFTQTMSESAGMRTWTLRPPKNKAILNSRQGLRVVFKGICPDNTTGQALIMIAYYDIKGYKDGYTTLLAEKIKPIPCVIQPKPTETLDFDLLNPQAGLEISLQFFGLDQVTLYRKLKDKDKDLPLVERGLYPAVMRNFKLTFADDQLWQDQELIAEYTDHTGGTITRKLANIWYKAALGVEWQKKVHHSNWVQLQQPINAISCVSRYRTRGKTEETVTQTVSRSDAGVNRYSLHYQSGQWFIILEIVQARWWQPGELLYARISSNEPYNLNNSKEGKYICRSGGGFFLVEDIRFDGSGAAQFTIRNMEIYTKDGLRTINLEGSIKIVDSSPVLDSTFLRQLSSQAGWECDAYCTYSFQQPLANGINRPQPYRGYSYGINSNGDYSSLRTEKYSTAGDALLAAEHVYGGYDYFYKDGVLIESTELCYLYPDNDQPPPANSRSAPPSLESNDWHGQSLQGRDLSSKSLDLCNFDDADLQGATLTSASLENASFQGANLVQVDGTSANLRQANLGGAQMNYAKFEQATFDGANLADASLLGANLINARFIGANLNGANFDSALVEGALFSTDSGLSDDQLEALRLRGALISQLP